MFDLLDQPMQLRYYVSEPEPRVYDAGPVRFDELWYTPWLEALVSMDENIIFFIVTETTDVFEKEMDFNTVVHMGDNQMISHTYSPECPDGCYGQLDECVYKKVPEPIGRVLDTRITDAGFEADVEFFCTGEKDCRGTTHANDCPKWEE